MAGETTALRGVRRHLRLELGLPATAYKAVGYWTVRAEDWNASYNALDADTRAASRRSGRRTGPRGIEDEYDARLTALGL